jgi:hypothetical protein
MTAQELLDKHGAAAVLERAHCCLGGEDVCLSETAREIGYHAQNIQLYWAAILAARQQERERIVAWLRRQTEQWIVRWFADAIDRGEHDHE